MAYCLENGSEMEKIAKKGKTLVQSRYGLDHMVDNYIRMYKDLVKKN